MKRLFVNDVLTAQTGHNVANFTHAEYLLSAHTCVHGPLSIQAVTAALIGLPTQSDSDWMVRQTTCTDRPVRKVQMMSAEVHSIILSQLNHS